MLRNEYQFTMELYTEKGDALGQVALDVDFDPACEWTRLAAMRGGRISSLEYDGDLSLLPLWHSKRSEPYMEGFRIRFETGPGREFCCDFLSRYFKNLATQASEHFVEQGKIGAGDRFIYFVAAFPRSEMDRARSNGDITIEDATPPPPFIESALSEFTRGSVLQGDMPPETFPIFVPRHVLDEAAALTRQADCVETGGILIGHLHYDPDVPEVFPVIRALIPAPHAQGELTKLTFTAETWTAVRIATHLRRKQEIMLGWFHSHPVRHWDCKNCPVERQRVCPLAHDFFSSHDRALHRTVFPRAWSIAIVANDVAFHDITFSVFGWNRAKVEPRGYYLLGD